MKDYMMLAMSIGAVVVACDAGTLEGDGADPAAGAAELALGKADGPDAERQPLARDTQSLQVDASPTVRTETGIVRYELSSTGGRDFGVIGRDASARAVFDVVASTASSDPLVRATIGRSWFELAPGSAANTWRVVGRHAGVDIDVEWNAGDVPPTWTDALAADDVAIARLVANELVTPPDQGTGDGVDISISWAPFEEIRLCKQEANRLYDAAMVMCTSKSCPPFQMCYPGSPENPPGECGLNSCNPAHHLCSNCSAGVLDQLLWACTFSAGMAWPPAHAFSFCTDYGWCCN